MNQESSKKTEPQARVRLNLSRKEFLEHSAKAAAVAGAALVLPDRSDAFPYEPYLTDDELKRVVTSCAHNCGARHILIAHKQGDTIVRLSADDGIPISNTYGYDPDHMPQLRACLRGRSYRSRIYSAERLLFPMMRTGRRGEGKFKRVSWDEALSFIAEKMVQIKEKYGNTAILDQSYAGASYGVLHKSDQITGLLGRFLGMFGSRTSSWSVPSYQGTTFSSRTTFGTIKDGNDDSEFEHSKLIVLWGWNPAYTFHGPNMFYHLRRAKQKGAKMVIVDPQYTDSAAAYDAWWIPIRPGTDAAMLAAMAYVIFQEKLEDRSFIKEFSVGIDGQTMPEGYEDFESFEDYILGSRDGVAKTPGWASEICGVSAEDITKLARMYATTKPAALKASWSPGRNAYGEQYNRMAAALQTMTGNIGIRGGSAEGVGKSWSPISVAYPWDDYTNLWFQSIKSDTWAKLVLNYPNLSREEIGLWPRNDDTDGQIPNIRAVWWHGSNWLNQLTNLNQNLKAIQKLDLVVSQDATITPSGMYADVLLPAATHFERHDVGLPWYKGAYYIHRPRVIAPLGESKTDFQIFTELAYRLEGHADVKDFGKRFNPKADRSYFDSNEEVDEAYLRDWWKKVQKKQRVKISWEEFKERGVYRFRFRKPQVAFYKQIHEKKPFSTETGKIEIFSPKLARYEKGDSWTRTAYGSPIPSIPKWIEPPEYSGSVDQVKRHPFQMVTPHPRWRTHSIYYNLGVLRETYTHEITINESDAKKLGIKSGDTVEAYNNRGSIILIAKVTGRIMPGVVSVCEGVWMDVYNGIDYAGNPDFLTDDSPSPAGAFAYNSILCNIRKTNRSYRPGWNIEQTSRTQMFHPESI